MGAAHSPLFCGRPGRLEPSSPLLVFASLWSRRPCCSSHPLFPYPPLLLTGTPHSLLLITPCAGAVNLSDSLTVDELEMTVEEYLKKQCDQRIDKLKRHVEGLIDDFNTEAKKARTVLREVAANAVGDAADDVEGPAAEEGSSAEQEPAGAGQMSDAFAMVVIRGMFAGKVFRFQPTTMQKKWTIGRAEDNDVSFNGDDEVSSNHAEISFNPKDKQFKILDKNSTNGTYVDTNLAKATRLKKKAHTLKVGQVLTIGSATTVQWCYHTDAMSIAKNLAKIQGK
jgi:hypothetical protein